MPEMPIARMMTPTSVPQTLTRPGLIVVEPRNSADQRRQQKLEADARLADAQLRGEDDAGRGRQRPRRHEGRDRVAATGMPFSAAALGLAPIA